MSKIWLKFRTPTNFMNMKMAKSASNRINAAAKKNFFDNSMTTDVSSHRDLSQAWNNLKLLKNNHRIPSAPLSVNGNSIETDSDKAEAFANEFAKVSQTSSLPPNDILYRQFAKFSPNMSPPSADDSQTFNSPISLTELQTAINSISKSKVAVGPDGVSYSMIKHFPPTFLDTLLSFFQLCFSRGVFPSRWKHSHIIPIHKQGKPRTQASSYRPISLTPHLSKIYERILKNRLEHHVESKNLLPTCQAGFRKSRSISDHLLTLTSSVKTALRKKRCLTAVFFDVRRAFDTVWHKKLLSKLSDLGLSGNLYNAIVSFLSHRSFSVRCKSSMSSPRATDCGVPQGTVLAPLLYNLVLSDLHQYIQNRCGDSIFITQYADDLTIWHTHGAKISSSKNHQKKTQTTIQTAIDAVQQYMTENGFSLAPEKTQLAHFSKGSSLYHPQLSLNDVPLIPTKQAKFLGVTFSPTLDWSAHINNLVTKASRALNLLKVAAQEPWGNNPKTLLHLSVALVRSRVQHGQECFHSAPQSLLKKLTSVDLKGIKIALGLPLSCNNKAAYAEAEILPLDRSRQMSVSKLLVRSFSVPNSSQPAIQNDINYDLHRQNKTRSLETSVHYTAPLLQAAEVCPTKVAPRPLPLIPPWLSLAPLVSIPNYEASKSDQPHLLKYKILEHLQTKFPAALHVFTDGSLREDGSVGAGVAIPSLKISKSFYLGSNLSIFTAEMAAITMALHTILSFPPSLHSVVIGVDSQAALKALSSSSPSARPDILSEIRHLCHCILSNGTCLSFLWTPSHVGVPGNEMADCAAKKGAAALPQSLPLIISPSVSELSSRLKSTSHSQWLSERATLFTEKQYPCYLPHNQSLTTSLPRTLGAIIRRLRTNSWHGRHFHLNCDCSSPFSPEHVVLYCPLYANVFTNIQAFKSTSLSSHFSQT